jgi:hypothetical protein
MDECDITVVERTGSDNGAMFWADLFSPGGIEATSVSDMVDKILAKLTKKGCCLKELTIIGHASSGDVSVGNGQTGTDPKKNIDGNAGVWGPELQRLQGRWCPNARITIGGCHFGAGQAGADKLFAIAQVIGVRVRGFTGFIHFPDWFDDGEWVEATPTQKPAAKGPPDEGEKKKALKTASSRIVTFREADVVRALSVDDILGLSVTPKHRGEAGPSPLSPSQLDAVRDALARHRPINATLAAAAIDAFVQIEVGGASQETCPPLVFSYLIGGSRYLVLGGDWASVHPLGYAMRSEEREGPEESEEPEER